MKSAIIDLSYCGWKMLENDILTEEEGILVLYPQLEIDQINARFHAQGGMTVTKCWSRCLEEIIPYVCSEAYLKQPIIRIEKDD